MATRDDDHHHAGLAHDLEVLTRRRMLGMVARATAGFSLVPVLAGCDSASSAGDAGTEACTRVPPETAGPFPGNGTNGANALSLSGIVRSDIRTSIGSAVEIDR